MKMPIPIHPPRRRHQDGLHPQHVIFAVTFLPVVGMVAYVVARIFFSLG